MPTRRRSFTYVLADIFTATPLKGAPIAVFPDARGLDDEAMLGLAREMNPYATTFVLPASSSVDDFRLRIFGTAPVKEWRFAGHPTIGTALVMRHFGLLPRSKERISIEEPIGPVAVRFDPRRDGELAWLTTLAIEFGPIFETDDVARQLGLGVEQFLPGVPAQVVSAGQPHLYVPLRTPEAVDAASSDLTAAPGVSAAIPLRFFLFAPTPSGAYARMFAPQLGFIEDPATGSAAGPLAAFMMRHHLAPIADGSRWICEQGTKIGRRSEMHVRINGEHGRAGIEVGGAMALLSEGTIHLH